MKDHDFLLNSDLPSCSKACIKCRVSCPVEDCRDWIDYEGDMNCTSISIKKNGSMTLREVAARLHISFVRVKQIEDKTMNKLETRLARQFGVERSKLREFIFTAFEE